MGVLYGAWQVGNVKSYTWELAKNLVGAKKKEYKEVPLFSEKHRIRGQADGWVKGLGDDFLIEIKSIGPGTIRFEAPQLFAGTNDVQVAWGQIRNPFRAHILQGQIYLHLCHLMVESGDLKEAPKEIVFIYELKATQDYKEFVVAYDPSYSEPYFTAALDVVWAVENKRPPACSIDSVAGCPRCKPYRGEANDK